MSYLSAEMQSKHSTAPTGREGVSSKKHREIKQHNEKAQDPYGHKTYSCQRSVVILDGGCKQFAYDGLRI